MSWSISTMFPWISALCALIIFFKFMSKFRRGSSKLIPPGPPGWPIVGNMFDLGQVPHQTLYELKGKYGPVIWLKLGAINTMVVQSAEAAAELFKKCDLPFADRKVPDSLTAFDYYQGSVAIGTYGDYWRKLRRICTTEFLVHKRINASISMRQRCVDNLIEWIKQDVEKSRKSGGSGEIELDRFLFVTAFNVIGNLMSRDVMDSRLEKASEFFDLFLVFMEWTGKPNIADFLPFLKWFDPQGIRRNSEKYLERLLEIASGIVKERIREKQSGNEKKHMIFWMLCWTMKVMTTRRGPTGSRRRTSQLSSW
ncbi:UNVERIFIED_CONTAM: Iridoid oxidase [Sesamum angustifolium]|uniref:Iridoid oxidase n=1 Tax=Sesamum angustifolium TaxID=2727405 RepID=A0AAW2MPK5_9LAMI